MAVHVTSSSDALTRPPRLPSALDPTTFACTAVLLGLFALHYGVLLGALFELFTALDYLVGSRAIDWPWAVRIVLAAAAGLLLARIAWRLSLSIVGLVTPKYDRPASRVSATSLSPDEHPQLFQLVSRVCQRLNAPLPDELRVSPTSECYVIEERQFSWRTARRLILVLGLPQLLVLTVAELQVILAHEMAHFRRGHTTRVVFLYRFAESLRLAISRARRRWWRWFDPVYWFCLLIFRLFVLFSAPVQRKQELRADCVSAAHYGGDIAVHTLLKDWLLENQFDSAIEEFLDDSQAESPRLHGSVYQLFVDRWRDYSAAGEEYLERRLREEERTSFFDPQPTINSRLSAMRSYPAGSDSDRGESERRQPANLHLDLATLEKQLHDQLLRALEPASARRPA